MRKSGSVSFEQPVYQIDRIALFLIDDLSVHLRHLQVCMSEQLRGRIEVGTERQHHRRKRVAGEVGSNIQSKQM